MSDNSDEWFPEVKELQYGYWGFRWYGSTLISYPTRKEAIDSYARIMAAKPVWERFFGRPIP